MNMIRRFGGKVGSNHPGESIRPTWRFVTFVVFTLGLLTSARAATWYVDNTATGLNNGTSWTNAWTNITLISGVSAGDTVYISGGPVGSSQTYNLTGVGWPGLAGSSNNPITYIIGQDGTHSGVAVFNGGGVGNPTWITINGNYQNTGSHFVFTNVFPNAIAGNQLGFALRYTTVQAAINLTGHLTELDHVVIVPAYNSLSTDIVLTDNSAQAPVDNFVHDCTITAMRQAPLSGTGMCDCNTMTNIALSGCGDWGLDISGGVTVSNCLFNTAAITNYATGTLSSNAKHGDAIQLNGALTGSCSSVRILGNTFLNWPQSAVVSYAGNYGCCVVFTNIWICNNVFDYTAPDFAANASPCDGSWAIALYPLPPNVVPPFSNVIVANNTIVDQYGGGIALGTYFTNGTGNAVVNNLVMTQGGNGADVTTPVSASTSTIWVACNKVTGVPSGCFDPSIQPPNNPGPLSTSPVTFVNWVPFSPGNDFHLASTDTGATGNGTNWPMQFFTADKDGNPRPSSGPWSLGAYEGGSGLGGAPPPGNNPPLRPKTMFLVK
jgi:hypothetical protein